MKGKFFLIVAGVAALLLSLTACGQSWPSEDTQVQQLMQRLQRDGHQIDLVADVTPARLNIGWEKETTTKKRRAGGKTIEIKSGTKVAEVVVVAPNGNCKFEIELVLNQAPTDAFYADEGRTPAGKEDDLDPKFNPDKPSPKALQDYVASHSGPLAFCADKPFAPSPHSND